MQTAAIPTTQAAGKAQTKSAAGGKKGGAAADGLGADFELTLQQTLQQSAGQKKDQGASDAQAQGLLGLMMAMFPAANIVPMVNNQVSGTSGAGGDAAQQNTIGANAAAADVTASGAAALNLQFPVIPLQAGQGAQNVSNVAAMLSNAAMPNNNAAMQNLAVMQSSPASVQANIPTAQSVTQTAAQTDTSTTLPQPAAPSLQAPGLPSAQTTQILQPGSNTQAMVMQAATAPQVDDGQSAGKQTQAQTGANDTLSFGLTLNHQGDSPTVQMPHNAAGTGEQTGSSKSETGSQTPQFTLADTGDSKSKTPAQQTNTAQASYQAVQNSAKLHSALSLGDKAGNAPTSAADVARQISDSVSEAVNAGHSELRLHLSPEDLGGISIKIISHGGALSLQITAENQHTGSLIAGSLSDLNKALSDKGVSFDRAEVLMGSPQGNGNPNSSQAGGSFARQQQQSREQAERPVWVPAMEKHSEVQNPQNTEDGRVSFVA